MHKFIFIVFLPHKPARFTTVGEYFFLYSFFYFNQRPQIHIFQDTPVFQQTLNRYAVTYFSI